MGDIIGFQKKEPIYCAQDLREYIGFMIIDVVSDECDCNAKLLLANDQTGEKALLDIDRALDGETIFAIRR